MTREWHVMRRDGRRSAMTKWTKAVVPSLRHTTNAGPTAYIVAFKSSFSLFSALFSFHQEFSCAFFQKQWSLARPIKFTLWFRLHRSLFSLNYPKTVSAPYCYPC